MLYYSPEPLCLLMFRLSPKWRIIRPQNLHYYRAKRCVIRLNPCIYWCSGYSPKWCVIPFFLVFLSFWFISTTQKDVLSTPPKLVLLPRKMVCYSPEPLYLLVFRLFPRMVCYYHAKCCITLPNPCIYWCLGYSPKCRITRAKRCVTINE